MRIGSVPIQAPLVLAPMAGFTDTAFRVIAKECGCGLVVTEMVSANGLEHNNLGTLKHLQWDVRERPLAVQLFGKDPEVLARSAAKVRDLGADIVDLNLGCPVRKVTKTGAGAALLKEPSLVERILTRVRRAVDCPLTIKMRAGWDSGSLTFLEVGRMAEQCGVDAVTLHPRTARQLFSGTADVSMIRRLKQEVGIPVIGNGDVTSPDQVLELMRTTGCDAVMVGRAALGNPWFFRHARALLEGRTVQEVPLQERELTIRRHLDLLKDLYGPNKALTKMRAHIGPYTRGLPHSAAFRGMVYKAAGEEAFLSMCARYFLWVGEGEAA